MQLNGLAVISGNFAISYKVIFQMEYRREFLCTAKCYWLEKENIERERDK